MLTTKIIFSVFIFKILLNFCFAVDELVLSEFEKWQHEYHQEYQDPDSLHETLEHFEENFKSMNEQQVKFMNGDSKFIMKINSRFGQNSTQRALLSGLVLDPNFEVVNNLLKGRTVKLTYPKPPERLDYRDLGFVTGVQDQGESCGSCYAFATTCAMEGQIAKKFSKLVDLSEQNIVDCSRNFIGNRGCRGGNTRSSYSYIIQNSGIAKESEYPYIGRDSSCKHNRSRRMEKVSSQNTLIGDENNLKAALAAIGPLSVGIRSNLETFYYYGSGIYDDPACDTKINHEVCLIGYGTDNTTTPPTDYWIIKNSWSTDWGENGYMRMQMGRNMCGITRYVIYPKL